MLKLIEIILHIFSSDIADKRSRLLERFLRRLGAHPRLVVDNDVRDFLSFESDLPKAYFTSTFSGNSVKKVKQKRNKNQLKYAYIK
jgi:hypothetical protein